MTRFWLIVALMALGVTAAGAAGSMMLLRVGPGSPNSGGAPPVCSNQLDFSDPCNSQYLF